MDSSPMWLNLVMLQRLSWMAKVTCIVGNLCMFQTQLIQLLTYRKEVQYVFNTLTVKVWLDKPRALPAFYSDLFSPKCSQVVDWRCTTTNADGFICVYRYVTIILLKRETGKRRHYLVSPNVSHSTWHNQMLHECFMLNCRSTYFISTKQNRSWVITFFLRL